MAQTLPLVVNFFALAGNMLLVPPQIEKAKVNHFLTQKGEGSSINFLRRGRNVDVDQDRWFHPVIQNTRQS